MSEKQSSAIKGIKGGKRNGAGRKKGVPNKRTAELQAQVEASGLTPLEFLLNIMRDGVNEPRDRMAAAIAAAPYVHAKLASVEVAGKDGAAIPVSMTVEFVRAHSHS
jgi:hypothetical protein